MFQIGTARVSATVTWMSYDVTPTFFSLSTGPSMIKDEDAAVLECFTIPHKHHHQ